MIGHADSLVGFLVAIVIVTAWSSLMYWMGFNDGRRGR